MRFDSLISAARQVRLCAYTPYSKFLVGAALLTQSGAVFVGCNIKNISFGLTICAEQAALAAAISNGQADFAAIAIVADSVQPPAPCGRCRQLLAEFNEDIEVVMSTVEGRHECCTLSNLLLRAKQGILESASNVSTAD